MWWGSRNLGLSIHCWLRYWTWRIISIHSKKMELANTIQIMLFSKTLVETKLKLKIQKLWKQELLNNLFQLAFLLLHQLSNCIQEVFWHLHHVEFKWIIQYWLLVTILKELNHTGLLRIHGVHHGDNLDISGFWSQLEMVFVESILILHTQPYE